MNHSDKHDCCQGHDCDCQQDQEPCCECQSDNQNFDFIASLKKMTAEAKEQAAECQACYQSQPEAKKQAIKKGLVIGGSVVGGLLLLKKIFGRKRQD